MDYAPAFLAPLVCAISLLLFVIGVRRIFFPGRFVERRLRSGKQSRPVSQSTRAAPSRAQVRVRGLLFIVAAPLLVLLTGVQVGIATPIESKDSDSQLRRLMVVAANEFLKQNSIVNLAVVAVADGKTEILCSGQR